MAPAVARAGFAPSGFGRSGGRQPNHAAPRPGPLDQIDESDADLKHTALERRPAENGGDLVDEAEADPAIDPDFGMRVLLQHALDQRPVPSRAQPQKFLMAVREVVGLVVGDHRERARELGVLAEHLELQVDLLRRALLGYAAVHEVADDFLVAEQFVFAQPRVRQPDAPLFEQHAIVGIRRNPDRRQAALLQQGGEQPAMLALVLAVPANLGSEFAVAGEQRDALVLPSALCFTLRRDAEQKLIGPVVLRISWKMERAESMFMQSLVSECSFKHTEPTGRVAFGAAFPDSA
jgi:hypothetical protein